MDRSPRVPDANCCLEEEVKITVRQEMAAVVVIAGANILQVGETGPAA